MGGLWRLPKGASGRGVGLLAVLPQCWQSLPFLVSGDRWPWRVPLRS
jgi:hypothetical protein